MSIDEFLEHAEACTTVEELGRAFRKAIESAGHPSAPIVANDAAGFLKSSLLNMPEQPNRIDAGPGCDHSNPMSAAAVSANDPFHLYDIAPKQKLTKQAQQTASACHNTDACLGRSTPFPGKGGTNLQFETKQDKRSKARISALAAIMQRRYCEICNLTHQCELEAMAAVPHAGGPPGMTLGHCHALVLIATAERRRAMSLGCMSRSITAYVSEDHVKFLLEWGYVVERPDDDAFEYRFAPSPLGGQHIATCNHARLLGRHACGCLDLPRGERPSIKKR